MKNIIIIFMFMLINIQYCAAFRLGNKIISIASESFDIQCDIDVTNDGKIYYCNGIHTIPINTLKIGLSNSTDINAIIYSCQDFPEIKTYITRSFDGTDVRSRIINSLWKKLKSMNLISPNIVASITAETPNSYPINYTDWNLLNKGNVSNITPLSSDTIFKIDLTRALHFQNPGSVGAVASLTVQQILNGQATIDAWKANGGY